jgi:hypothetical protein
MRQVGTICSEGLVTNSPDAEYGSRESSKSSEPLLSVATNGLSVGRIGREITDRQFLSMRALI